MKTVTHMIFEVLAIIFLLVTAAAAGAASLLYAMYLFTS